MELNQPSSSSSSSRHGRSQHNAELGQDDNPFVVPIRAPQSSQTSFNQLASARRVASQDLMYEEDNPFMHSRYKLSEESSGPAEVLGTASASASATSTPSRRFRTSAVPQVVDYDDLSFLDQNIFNGDSVSQRPTLSTPKRHAYSPHQPSLMSPSSIRHMNYHTVVTEPAPSAPKFLEKMTPVSPKEIERSSLKKEVVQIKVELKKWEAAFKKSRGRDATQDDIAKDPAMVRKYRDYSKLKKALAASKEPKDSKLTAGSVVNRPRTDSRSSPPTSLRLQSKTRPSELLRTPTKHSRTQHIAEDQLLRTPCLKLNQFAEESLVRTPGSRKGATEYVSPRHIGRHASLMSPGERDQYLSTPSLLRVGNLDISPSMQTSRVRLRSIGSTTPLQTYMFQVGQGIPEAPSERKSTHKLTSTTLLRSPIHGSPHFGGMNNRRKRAVPAHIFVQEDMSETQELQESQESKSLLDTKNVITSELTTAASETSEWMGDHNPLLKTPQKSGAAKAARALFRRPSHSGSLSGSPQLRPLPALQPFPSSPSRPFYIVPNSTTIFHQNAARSHRRPGSATPIRKHSHCSVRDALDLMTLEDLRDAASITYDDGGRWVDEDNSDITHENQSPVVLHSDYSSPVFDADALLSPSKSRARTEVLRTPSQQPSLTFSQITPGSARSEPDLFMVPPGFHSLYRRKPVRSSFFMTSQEDDAKFELEYNVGMQYCEQGSLDEDDTTINIMGFDDGHTGDSADQASSTLYSDDDGGRLDEGSVILKGVRTVNKHTKKKYTQKRTTRLHRIHVAHTEKAAQVRVSRRKVPERQEADSTKNSAEIDYAPDNFNLTEGDISVSQDNKDAERAKGTVSEKTSATTKFDPDSLSSGWANSNKPLVKSDRRYPGVGQGRAGAKRTSLNFATGISDGNYVAYNLQRGSFRKRGSGRGGRSRFSGTNFSNPTASTTGRSLFDNDSWRTDFDKDFDDRALVMSAIDNGLDLLADEDEDGLPWYGLVDDIFDPHVVTVSNKYLQKTVGELNDPDEFVKQLKMAQESQNLPHEAKGYEKDQGFKVNLLYILRNVWGHTSFRDGQLDSVKRSLRYQSSLLVLPTGSGKSLSYQLPAYVLSKLGVPSLTLVISPMISLMYDQVKHLPPGLTGACWTSVEQTTAQFKVFLESLRNNTIKILFISPEKLQSQSFLNLVQSRQVPRISFVCVDEVHCLSEWSHNFRPAYLLLNHVLKTALKSPCVLSMTGTATEGTKDSICAMLEIDRTTGVLSGAVIRDNLVMTVSLENDRESALLYLLQSPKFAKMDSILIYVMKQAQADALAAFLRVRSFSAESYHAGKSTQDRQRIQERFMNTKSNSSKGGIAPGGIRILCATIAFGLGLNKSNIRSVIHFSMPKSLENYIQEIGRSGRDGLPSNCHMFLNQTDYLSLRSLAYANGMDLGSLLRLIKKLFSRKSLVAHAGSISVKSAHPGSSKKRRAPKMEQKNKDEQVSSAENSDEEREPKKRRQNNNIAVAVRDSSSGSGLRHGADFGSLREQQLRGLVTSGESILVIPQGPVAMGQRSVSATETGIVATSKRLVVVREEIIEQEFDIKKEVLATLLSYIELDPSHPIKVIGSVSSKCTVKLLKSDEELFEIIRQAPLIDLVIKYGVLTGHSNSGNGQGGRKGGYGYKAKSRGGGIGGSTLSNAYCCDAMSLCQQHGITFTELVQELQLWKRKKWVVFELTDPGFCVEIVREPAACTVQQKTAASENRDTEEEDRHDMFVQQLGERLYRKLCAIERVGVAKVDHVYELFHKVATPTWQQQKAFTSPIVNERDKENSDANYGVQLRDEEILDSMMESEGDIVAVSQRQRPATALSSSTKVTEAELVLRSGIEEYFARRSGEGIGGVSAAEELFGEIPGSTDTQKTAAQSPTAMNDKMLHLYQYHNVLVAEMQSKWRSAVEVDLKVFLAQQYQQYEQQLQQSSSSAGRSFVPKPIDSPRVVSRIFHGIHSPCYPVMDWGRDKYWGKYVHFDFGTMMQMAGRILSEQRERRAAKSNVQ